MSTYTKPVKINLDLEQNLLKNVVIESLATNERPANAKVGFIYFDTTENAYGYCYGLEGNTRLWRFFASKEEMTTALAGKQNLAVPAAAGNLATLNASGQVTDSQKAFVTTLGPASGTGAATDAEVPTAKAVRDAISAATPKVDNATIELAGANNDTLQVKDGGLTVEKFNAADLDLANSEQQTAAHLPSTAKVGELIVAERIATATLTGKTIDVDNNTVSNIEVDNFKASAIVTSSEDIGPATGEGAATDAELPTALAVRDAIDASEAKMTLSGTGPITVTYGNTKTVSIADASTSVKGAVQLADSTAMSTGTSESLAATPKGVHDEITAALVGGLKYRGTWTITTTEPATSDFSGLNSYLPIKKGDLFAITGTGPIIISGVEYNPGDHLIANQDVAAGATIVGTDFDKIDNTEAADIVRLNETQTLKNKTLDLATGSGAGNNAISNAQLGIFASGVVVDSTDGIAEAASASDDKMATEKAIRVAIDNAVGANAVHITTVTTTDVSNFDWKDSAHDSAVWQITSPLGADHKVMKAQLLIASTMEEVDAAVSYNQSTGTVEFGINTTALPADGYYKAIILG